jgi:hypothetical protein
MMAAYVTLARVRRNGELLELLALMSTATQGDKRSVSRFRRRLEKEAD